MQAFRLYQRSAGIFAHLSALLIPLLPWLLVWRWHAEPWLGFALVWLGFAVAVAALLIGILMLGDSVRWGLGGGYVALRLTPRSTAYNVTGELLHVMLLPAATALSLGGVWLFVRHLRGATLPEVSPTEVLLGVLALASLFLAMRLAFVMVRVQARSVLSLGLAVAFALTGAVGGLSSLVPLSGAAALLLLSGVCVLLGGLNMAQLRRP